MIANQAHDHYKIDTEIQLLTLLSVDRTLQFKVLITAHRAANLRAQKGTFAGLRGSMPTDLLLQMRTLENNTVGDTAPVHGDVEAALGSIKRAILYVPSETDLYFPVSDARYEAAFIPHDTLLPIPS